jgi:hypothetical protein
MGGVAPSKRLATEQSEKQHWQQDVAHSANKSFVRITFLWMRWV